MSLQIRAQAELERRRRQQTAPPPDNWQAWLPAMFPAIFAVPFAAHQIEFWQWVESITIDSKPNPFIAVWARGGGKTSSVEAATVRLAAKGTRKFCLYIRSTQDKANESVTNIAAMLESRTITQHYPLLSERKLGKYGFARGWRVDTLRCASGFSVIGLGLDAAVRGIKIEEQRPDIIFCHKKGTRIFVNNRWDLVENHPSAHSYISDGFNVTIFGIPFYETVSNDHLYYVKQFKLKKGRLDEICTGWQPAHSLNKHSYIGLPIDYSVEDVQPVSVYEPGVITQRDAKGRVVAAGGNYVKKIPEYFRDPDWWWLIGLWWGDGHIAGKTQVIITVADKQPEIADKIYMILARYNIKHSAIKKVGCSQVVFSCSVMNRWFRTWKTSKAAAQKCPPQWVEKINFELQKEFVKGYIDSDGFIDNKHNQLRITSVSLNGLLCLSRILARLNIPSYIRKGIKGHDTEIVGVKCSSQDKYDIMFRQNVKILGYDIENQTRYSYGRCFIKDGFIWRKIHTISNVQNQEFIAIKTDEGTYITDFGLSHNCDDLDDVSDAPRTVLRKIEVLTTSILPAGATNVAIGGVQNLIHEGGIFAQLVSGQADFLLNCQISGPHPAVVDLVYESLPEGGYRITGGTPTWEGQSLAICESQINEWGLASFLREAQHEIETTGGIWDDIAFRHIDQAAVPDIIRGAVWIDPAVTSTDESDCQAMQADGLGSDGKLYRFYSWEGITTPEDIVTRAVLKCLELGFEAIGIETDQGGDTWQSVYAQVWQRINEAAHWWVKLSSEGGQEAEDWIASHTELAAVAPLANDIVTQRLRQPQFRSAKAGQGHGSKVARNQRMLVSYEQGKVIHVTGTHSVLERALKRFPNKPLDLADAAYWGWWDLVDSKTHSGSVGRVSDRRAAAAPAAAPPPYLALRYTGNKSFPLTIGNTSYMISEGWKRSVDAVLARQMANQFPDFFEVVG